MEEKQLDFNAPLLSVRRFSSIGVSPEGDNRKREENSLPKKASFPPYKPELKSGPVRNASAVPFLWEQIPGRPKDGGEPQFRPLEWRPTAPKLPPGRILEVKQQPSEKEFEDPNVIWPRNDKVLPNRQKVLPLDDSGTKLQSSKESMKEEGSSDSKDGDDAFTDALDTLSRSESCFFNCSVSGVSGLDGPDVKPSGTFSTDPQTRDFMMGRFLPAAKAMTSETPQYASRKQLVTREQPRQSRKVVNGDRRPPLYQYRPNFVPHYVQDTGEDESEDEDGGYDDPGNLSAKACGLFPRFCLKNSFLLLNPVPGMKVRSRAPLSSVRKVSTQAKTAYYGSHCETDDEHNWDNVYKHKLMDDLQPPGPHEDESKLTSESKQLTIWSGSQTPDGSSPFRHSSVGGISPYRNEAPQTHFQEGMGFLGIPKQVKNFKANSFDPYKKDCNGFPQISSHQRSKRGSGSLSPTVEKTLYVDSVHAETPNSNSSYSDTKELMDYADKDSEILVERQGMKETPVAESCRQDITHLNILKERGILQPKTLKVVDADLHFSSERSNIRGNMDIMEGFRQDDGPDQEYSSLVCSRVPINRNMTLNKSQPLKEDDQGNSSVISLQTPLPPPLPKSPSESWLWRTLPSVSSRNSSSQSYLRTQFHPCKLVPKTSSTDLKRETTVKTSNVHHQHSRFAKELIMPVSQQSET